eukprot:1342262-Amorphochlora_amoeboformis.AAC.2
MWVVWGIVLTLRCTLSERTRYWGYPASLGVQSLCGGLGSLAIHGKLCHGRSDERNQGKIRPKIYRNGLYLGPINPRQDSFGHGNGARLVCTEMRMETGMKVGMSVTATSARSTELFEVRCVVDDIQHVDDDYDVNHGNRIQPNDSVDPVVNVDHLEW